MIKIAPVDRLYNDIKDSLQEKFEKIFKPDHGPFREGPYSKECEEIIKEMTGRRYALMTTSGTASLQCGYLAMGLKPGDEVIMPNLSASSSIMPALAMGARCIYQDINMLGQHNFDGIEQIITKKTKFIQATGLYGDSHDHDKIKDLGLMIMNDSAQSFSSLYKGVETTKLGDVSIMSFSINKVAPTFGTYGCVLTDDEKLFTKLQHIRRCGEALQTSGEVGTTDILEVGMNAQPHEEKCAQVLCALEKFPEWSKRRKQICEYYDEQLASSGIMIRQSPDYSTSNLNKYIIFVDDNLQFKKKMKESDIEVTVQYKHNFAGDPVNYPVTNFYNHHVLTIPSHPWLDDGEVDKVVNTLKQNFTPEDLALNETV